LHVTLDGTDCPIQEPQPFNEKWYSHKLNGPGIRYELGLNIITADIVWVNGGYPCGEFSDLKLARQLYVDNVDECELTLADDTYKDRRYFIYPSRDNNTLREQKLLMSRHETLNRRLKQFSVLSQRFRHKRMKHPLCFYAVANITQVMIDAGYKPYQI
jgi:hypothetical protein